jgi:hypothetical protein
VHLTWGPGVELVWPAPSPETWPETWGRHLSHYLRAYLACGVTTVLDAAAPPGTVQAVRGLLASGSPGPRYLTLGPFLGPAGGYGSGPIFASVGSVEEVGVRLDELQSLGAIGVKVPIEAGFSPFRALPLLPPELLEAIRRGAAERGLPIYVHATEEEHQRAALDLGARALVHPVLPGLGRSQQLSSEFVARMARSGAYQMTTLSIMDSWVSFHHPERLDHPLLELVAPDDELAAARDPDVVRRSRRALVAQEAGWLPGFVVDRIASLVLGEDEGRDGLRRAQEALRGLQAGGVPIVVGSDTVYSTLGLHVFHGWSSLREIELLAEAGFSPEQALASATRIPAEMLGLGDEVGTIEVGKRADLVIVREDPLAEVRALRSIEWTVRDGVARTPDGWMSEQP